MLAYIVKRLLLMIPTLIGILLVSFALVQELRGASLAGEVSTSSAGLYRGGQGVDSERLKEIRELYGFDKPATQRFIEMLERYARFDLGYSYFHHKSVWQLIIEKLPVSSGGLCGSRLRPGRGAAGVLWRRFLSAMVSASRTDVR